MFEKFAGISKVLKPLPNVIPCLRLAFAPLELYWHLWSAVLGFHSLEPSFGTTVIGWLCSATMTSL